MIVLPVNCLCQDTRIPALALHGSLAGASALGDHSRCGRSPPKAVAMCRDALFVQVTGLLCFLLKCRSCADLC
jgi:hypothetical protein